jgi:acetylornithine/succinyldiaminopimelate/putrescine aminotransferase
MASIQAICLSRFCEVMQGKGILAKETPDNVIRFAPPLVIDKETIDWALPSIRDVLNMNNIRRAYELDICLSITYRGAATGCASH